MTTQETTKLSNISTGLGVAGQAANFIPPPWGTAASAVLGVASAGVQLYSDIKSAKDQRAAPENIAMGTQLTGKFAKGGDIPKLELLNSKFKKVAKNVYEIDDDRRHGEGEEILGLNKSGKVVNVEGREWYLPEHDYLLPRATAEQLNKNGKAMDLLTNKLGDKARTRFEKALIQRNEKKLEGKEPTYMFAGGGFMDPGKDDPDKELNADWFYKNVLKFEGGVSTDPRDGAAKVSGNQDAPLVNGKLAHTNKGVTYSVFKSWAKSQGIPASDYHKKFLSLTDTDVKHVVDMYTVNSGAVYFEDPILRAIFTGHAWGGGSAVPGALNETYKNKKGEVVKYSDEYQGVKHFFEEITGQKLNSLTKITPEFAAKIEDYYNQNKAEFLTRYDKLKADHYSKLNDADVYLKGWLNRHNEKMETIYKNAGVEPLNYNSSASYPKGTIADNPVVVPTNFSKSVKAITPSKTSNESQMKAAIEKTGLFGTIQLNKLPLQGNIKEPANKMSATQKDTPAFVYNGKVYGPNGPAGLPGTIYEPIDYKGDTSKFPKADTWNDATKMARDLGRVKTSNVVKVRQFAGGGFLGDPDRAVLSQVPRFGRQWMNKSFLDYAPTNRNSFQNVNSPTTTFSDPSLSTLTPPGWETNTPISALDTHNNYAGRTSSTPQMNLSYSMTTPYDKFLNKQSRTTTPLNANFKTSLANPSTANVSTTNTSVESPSQVTPNKTTGKGSPNLYPGRRFTFSPNTLAALGKNKGGLGIQLQSDGTKSNGLGIQLQEPNPFSLGLGNKTASETVINTGTKDGKTRLASPGNTGMDMMAGDWAQVAGQAIPGLFNLGMGLLNKPEDFDPMRNDYASRALDLMARRSYNPEPIAQRIGREELAARNSINNNTSSDAIRRANLVSLRAKGANAQSMADLEGQKLNNEYRGEEAQLALMLGEQDRREAGRTQILDTEAKLAKSDLIAGGVSQLASAVGEYGKATNNNVQNNLLLASLQQTFPDVEWSMEDLNSYFNGKTSALPTTKLKYISSLLDA